LLAQNWKEERSTLNPEPGMRYAMMSRTASPRASRTRMPPAAFPNPVRDGSALTGSGSPIAGTVKSRTVSSER
jgi:hypothetical protein